jgi:hypothetical protein
MNIESDFQFLEDIAIFVASTLGLNPCNITVNIAGTFEESSYCSMDSYNNYDVIIQAGMSEKDLVKMIAHEFVHIRQVQQGRLIITPESLVWEDKNYPLHQFESDEYFLSPWEMEARALEDWIFHKWSEHVY